MQKNSLQTSIGRTHGIDGIRRVATVEPLATATAVLVVPRPSRTPRVTEETKRTPRYRFAFASLVFLLMCLSFGSGVLAVLETTNILAENSIPSEPASLPPVEARGRVAPQSLAAFSNTTVEDLRAYAQAPLSEQQFAERKQKLKAYLQSKHSPFANDNIVETIATQKHWQLILAISFAESTLGRSCRDNNCSGIGVAPGHPYWRTYKAVKNWVVDLDSLLTKRYDNVTLKNMCGVYVKPCNENWLVATQQIYEELEQWGIE